jgi:hypothetical protein
MGNSSVTVYAYPNSFTCHWLRKNSRSKRQHDRREKGRSQQQKTSTPQTFNLAPFTWHSYAYANFIDSEVITYYNNSYERSKETAQSLLFSYDANVYAWNQTHAVYDMTSSSIRVSSPNGTILFPSQRGWGIQIRNAYLTYSRYQEINADEIDFSFSNCYVCCGNETEV